MTRCPSPVASIVRAAAATAFALASALAFPAPFPMAPAIPALAPAPGSGGTVPEATAPVELSIRFFDKRIYYPEGEIPLKVTLSNNGSDTYRFKLADDRMFSLGFDARTPTNRQVEPSDGYRLAMADSKPVFYREVSLKSGEEYSFIERLERYVHLPDAGSYAVKAVFYPELASGSVPPVVSNVLMLSVRPSPGLPPALDLIQKETGEILKAQMLPPDEVVRRTLVARQKGLWNEFFLYLDTEALLTSIEDRKIPYDRESDEGRRRMLERFRADLQTNMVDTDLVVQPFFFDITETRYTPSRGFVRVVEKFRDQQLVRVKEYTYELQKREDIWRIVAYTVLNKGTE